MLDKASRSGRWNVLNLGVRSGWSRGISAEGHDKPVKYPAIFATSEVVLNKVYLIERVDFDRDFFYRSLHALNPAVKTFEDSCRTGEGLTAWSEWLLEQYTALH